jgi:glycosyltransferase involved in cell wall biosynthesis
VQTNQTGSERGPLVSVAIPVFNGQATVAQTLRSVLEQTYRHIEIIVVDDGSTDGTWEVLQSFGSSIRAIRQPNGGLHAARNTGVQAATGDYVALMDADDLCEPERLACQVRFLNQHPAVVLCSTDFSAFNAAGPVSASHSARYYSRCSAAEGGVAARFPQRGQLDIGPCLPQPPAAPVVASTYFGNAYAELALGNFLHPPTLMFRRSVIKEAGLFEAGAKTMCDWDWLVKVAHAGAVAFIDRPLLRYRLSETQMSSSDRALTDSLLVAHRICDRDATLCARQPQQFRNLFGEMYADAADARADKQPLQALSMLATSVLRYRRLTGRTLRTLVKIVTPSAALTLVRAAKRRLPLSP